MAVEQLAERMPDRSGQVIALLGELSERLRRSELERDLFKREILNLRETLEDVDNRNSQTQRAILAFENKFDSTEITVETAIRRLTGMEEALDKQSTELLSILRKIEERFEVYDREYKNHAASIDQYADTLDRFEKKLEKLMQDKGRISRKLDALEFQLADAEERYLGRSGSSAALRSSLSDEISEEMPAAPASSPAAALASTEAPFPASPAAGIQVWTPESAKPGFMHGPSEIPQPTFIKTSVTKWSGQVWQYLSVGLLVLILGALSFSMIYALIRHPGKTGSTTENTASNQASTKETKAPESTQKEDKADSTSNNAATKPDSAPDLPQKDFFSKSVRGAMDQQITAARKLEDDDTARLMAMSDTTSLSKRLTRDGSLPRPIQAIESKAFDGDIGAQHDMGVLYSSGRTQVGVDYIRASKWFRVAAEQGSANARYNLGVLYQQGLGVEKDIDQALSWYRSAALLDHPVARYNLGIAYVEGIGVTYNPAMAAGYFEQSARAGVIEAAYNLGLILENGLIDEQRPYEALFWYKLSADGGSTDGQSALFRLLSAQEIKPDQFQKMFDRMIAERPDLKQLADSHKSRGLSSESEPPRVRVHTMEKSGADGNNKTARKIEDLNDVQKPAVKDRIIQVPTPTGPALTTKTGTAAFDPQMVARIQTMLSDEGLYTGATDGVMGPATTNAIRKYQTKYSLPVDGKPSTNLMAQMLARRLAASVKSSETLHPPTAPTKAAGTIPGNN